MNAASLRSRLTSAREPLLWLLAVAAAVATGFGARTYLRASETAARLAMEQKFHPVPVVVARSDLAPGSALAPELLAVRNMPSDYLPSNAVRAAHAGDVLGRTVLHAVRAGEPIQTPLLKAPNVASLSQRIALGRRAVTIAVDESSAAAGLLRPGDRIDLRWRGGGEPLLNIPVLATGPRLAAGDEREGGSDYSTLTLELAENDARRLAEAAHGDVRVVLRNPSDTGDESIARVAAAPRVPMPTVPLIIGGGGGPVPVLRLLVEGAR